MVYTDQVYVYWVTNLQWFQEYHSDATKVETTYTLEHLLMGVPKKVISYPWGFAIIDLR